MSSPIPDCFLALLVAGAIAVFGAAATHAVPVNDDVLQATEVTGTEFTVAADLAGATRESFEPEEPGLYGTTVWWRWSAPESGVYAWNAAASPNPAAVRVLAEDGLSQWSVPAETYLRPVPGSGIFGIAVEPDPTGSFIARSGQRYWFRVDGVQGGGFPEMFPGASPNPFPVLVQFQRLSGTPLPNDHFADRLVLTLASPLLEGTLTLATPESGEPPAHAAASGRTLWWEWTAPDRGTATLRFANTNAAPLVTVYRRAPWQRLEPIASSATEFGNQCVRFWHARGSLDFDTDPDETYLLQLDAFPDFDRSAPFRGQLAFVPAPADDLLATPSLLSGMDWTRLASNEGATGSPSDPQVPGQPGMSSIWYRWDLPSPGLVQITTGEPTVFADPDVEILPPGGNSSGGVVVTWNPGPCSGPFEDLHPIPSFLPVIALFHRFGSSGDRPLLEYRSHGTNEVWAELADSEVWIQMDGPQGVTGTARLNGHLTPPPRNDRRTQRVVLPSAPVRVTGRSAGATAEADEFLPDNPATPPGLSHVPRRTVWWEWRAPSSGPWALHISAGLGDHYFCVYRQGYQQGAIPAALSSAEPALFQATADEVFQIGVFDLWGLGGNLEFRLTPASPPPLNQPHLEFDGMAGLWWVFRIPLDWAVPFQGETSPDLRTWTPVSLGWSPGTGAFRIPFDPNAAALFLRLRVGEDGKTAGTGN